MKTKITLIIIKKPHVLPVIKAIACVSPSMDEQARKHLAKSLDGLIQAGVDSFSLMTDCELETIVIDA